MVGHRSQAVRTSLAALATVGALAVSSCVPAPTSCAAVLEFDGRAACAAGPQEVPGSPGVIRQTFVFGDVTVDAATNTARLTVASTSTVGLYASAGDSIAFVESSTGPLSGFGPGDLTLSGDPAHSLTFEYVGNWSTSSGWLRVAKLELEPEVTPGFRTISRLSATFEVIHDGQKIAGAVSIGSD